MNKKEGVIFEFEIDFKKSFCCGFNLGNSGIIQVLCKLASFLHYTSFYLTFFKNDTNY